LVVSLGYAYEQASHKRVPPQLQAPAGR
jgi:hypothetical protein